MPLYRILRDLQVGSTVVRCGGVSRLSSVSQKGLEKLLELEKISQVSGPPMSSLPTWGFKSKKLEKVGLGLSTDFLDADDNMLADLFKTKVSLVHLWKKEVEGWLTVEGPQLRKS